MSMEELEDSMNKMLLDYQHILTPEEKILWKQKHNEEQKKNGKTNGSNE